MRLWSAFVEEYHSHFDWGQLSKSESLSPEQLIKFKVDWKELSHHPGITSKFVLNYLDKLNINNLCLNPKINFWLYQNYDLISSHLYLNPLFPILEVNDWDLIWERSDITPTFINNNINKVNWDNLSRNSQVTSYLLDYYPQEVNFEVISEVGKLTKDHLEDFYSWLDPVSLCQNINLNINDLVKIFDLEDLSWMWLSNHPGVGKQFIQEYQDWIEWDYLGSNPLLTEEWLSPHWDQLSSKEKSINPNLSLDFIQKKTDLSWRGLSSNKMTYQLSLEKQLEVKIGKIKDNWVNIFWNPTRLIGRKRLNRSFVDDYYSVW